MASRKQIAPPPVSATQRRIEDLERLRVSLLSALADPEQSLAAVSKELRAVNAELVELTKGAEVSGVDDLRARRDQRRAVAPPAPRSGRSG